MIKRAFVVDSGGTSRLIFRSEQTLLSQTIGAGYTEIPPGGTFMTGFVGGLTGTIDDPDLTYNDSVIGELWTCSHDGTNTWITIAYPGAFPSSDFIKDFKINGSSIVPNYLDYFENLFAPGSVTYLFSGTSGIIESTNFTLELTAE